MVLSWLLLTQKIPLYCKWIPALMVWALCPTSSIRKECFLQPMPVARTRAVVDKFHDYLYGDQFTVRTKQQSFDLCSHDCQTQYTAIRSKGPPNFSESVKPPSRCVDQLGALQSAIPDMQMYPMQLNESPVKVEQYRSMKGPRLR